MECGFIHLSQASGSFFPLGYSLRELSWAVFRPLCDMVTFPPVIITIDWLRSALVTVLEQLRVSLGYYRVTGVNTYSSDETFLSD